MLRPELLLLGVDIGKNGMVAEQEGEAVEVVVEREYATVSGGQSEEVWAGGRDGCALGRRCGEAAEVIEGQGHEV